MPTSKTSKKQTAVKHIKWFVNRYRASMCDMAEYTAWMYSKKDDIPYSLKISFYYRDNGVREYTAIIQGKVAEEIRGWWMINTFLHSQGTFTDPDKVVASVEKFVGTKLGSLSYITIDEYYDWADNHPIQKKRRIGSDWGVFITSRTSSERGWYDKVFKTIYVKNTYATRFASKEDAQKTADKLAKNNPGWIFEVRQMGKLDQ